MGSGEIPIEPGDSWFSRNSFRASLKCKSLGGRALIGLGPHRITEFSQTPNANDLSLGVRLRVIRSVVKGKQPRPPANPKVCIKWKRMWSCLDN